MWIAKRARKEFGDHPHALRTWIRGRIPWFLIDLGVASFGRDCETLSAQHNWSNIDGRNSRCMFCGIEREGRLWETSPYVGARVWHDLKNAERHKR